MKNRSFEASQKTDFFIQKLLNYLNEHKELECFIYKKYFPFAIFFVV